MSDKPLVSIIMLLYNNVQYLKSAIESVKAQTYKNWELVINDDRSTDGAYELALVFAKTDKRIRVSRNDRNIGTVKNRKKTYSLTKGELVCHLDNDDMLERWALEEMVNAFAQQPLTMLLYSDIVQIGKKNEVELYSASPTYDKEKLHQHGWRHFGMYRRLVMQYIDGYNDKLVSACEDGDLFMQIAEKFPIQRLEKPLYLYRNHGENNSHKNLKCQTCPSNPDCNYVRVWAASLNYDQRTLEPKVDHESSSNNSLLQGITGDSDEVPGQRSAPIVLTDGLTLHGVGRVSEAGV